MTKLAPEMMTHETGDTELITEDRSSIGDQMVYNASPQTRRTVLGIVAVNKRAIDYCDGCIDRRPAPTAGWDMCAREALLDSARNNGGMAPAALQACVKCADVVRTGDGKMPSHGLWPASN
jgi:hypothetical protein